MQYEQRTFQTRTVGRAADVCRAQGKHGEPDRRGRCFLCGTPLPDALLPELETDARDDAAPRE